MTSAKQLANQKRFAMRARRGDFRKAIAKSKKVKTKSTNPHDTKEFKINNFEAGEFDVYLDWSTPSELGIYVDRPDATGMEDAFSTVIINLASGKHT